MLPSPLLCLTPTLLNPSQSLPSLNLPQSSPPSTPHNPHPPQPPTIPSIPPLQPVQLLVLLRNQPAQCMRHFRLHMVPPKLQHLAHNTDEPGGAGCVALCQLSDLQGETQNGIMGDYERGWARSALLAQRRIRELPERELAKLRNKAPHTS